MNSGTSEKEKKSGLLREDVQRRIDQIGQVDILIGVPSYNNASTIAHVVRAVQAGLAKYFPTHKAILVNSDGGSTDGTMEVVQEAMVEDLRSLFLSESTEPLYKIMTPYLGLPGKGSAFRTIFQIAKELNAKACAVVDSDLRSITPEWIDLLIRPVLIGHNDFVAPYYLRHKYDGTITNSIVYPITRALYGRSIRQPIGGDFGFSGKLAAHYLAKDVWETDIARFGIDIWMTTTAVAEGYRVCQSFLGAKIHDAKDPGSDLSAMLHQVVSAIFHLMETYADTWRHVEESKPVEMYGFRYDVGLEPVKVNLGRMIEKYRLAAREFYPLWLEFMSEELVNFLSELAKEPEESFHMPNETWAEIVYTFAIAAHTRRFGKQHLLKTLTPLYLGRVASFINDTAHSDAREVEEKIESLCQAFEQRKDFLAANWE